MNSPLLFNIENELSRPKRIFTMMSGELKLTVHENKKYRWLAMDDTIQTVMDLTESHKPTFPHIHSMILSLYFQSSPQRIFELGLGGGALTRFFTHHFPNVKTTTYEINQDIIDIYQKYFCSEQAASQNHQIIAKDARLAVPSKELQDMIIVDLFAGNQPPKFLNKRDFYQDCKQSLTPEGLLIVNLLPTSNMQTLSIEKMLKDTFGNQPMIFSVPMYRNRIMMVSPSALPNIQFDDSLHKLCDTYSIDLMNIVQMK